MTADQDLSAPNVIYLQAGGDYASAHEVTWCQHSVDDTDTAYMRHDLHLAAVQAAVAKAVEAEREECADVAVNRHWHWIKLGNACLVDDDASACADIAAAIRSRGVAG